jgi:hypothetical protein
MTFITVVLDGTAMVQHPKFTRWATVAELERKFWDALLVDIYMADVVI